MSHQQRSGFHSHGLLRLLLASPEGALAAWSLGASPTALQFFLLAVGSALACAGLRFGDWGKKVTHPSLPGTILLLGLRVFDLEKPPTVLSKPRWLVSQDLCPLWAKIFSWVLYVVYWPSRHFHIPHWATQGFWDLLQTAYKLKLMMVCAWLWVWGVGMTILGPPLPQLHIYSVQLQLTWAS